MLYRALDAVTRLREEGVDVGLINKVTLNVVDEQVIKEIGSTEFVLVAESLNQRTGLGSKVSNAFNIIFQYTAMCREKRWLTAVRHLVA